MPLSSLPPRLIMSPRLLVSAAAALLLSGCGDGSLTRTFGLTHDAPDEFTVVTRAPLSMPPDFNLRPPQPGAPRPQEQSERLAAESALVPEAALASPRAGITRGQAALVRDAGGGVPVDIRQRVDREARASEESLVDKLLYWRGNAARAQVDPSRESQRLRQNAALGQSPVAGDTPDHPRAAAGLVPGPVRLAVAAPP